MKKLSLLGAVLLAGGLVTNAQEVSGTITGVVLDPSGAVVPNAKIAVTNNDRNLLIRTMTTDASGVYSATFLPIGNYALKASADGFKTTNRSGIVLNVNDVLKINLVMEVGAVSETVEVKEVVSTVDLSTPASEGTIEGTQVRELALGTRNFAQLVTLMPGVVDVSGVDELFPGTSGANGTNTAIPYAVNGMRNSANNWMVDGADNIDRGSNTGLNTFPSVDAIAQFKVQRSSYTADTGRAGGGQINVVTRSGSSKFHGSLFEFFRNDALNANTWTNNANRVNVVDGRAKPTPIRWNDFGGNLGGPVYFGGYNKQHNKTFFFYSEEVRRIIQYVTFNPTWPTAGMAQGRMIQPVCLTTIAASAIGCPAGATPVTSIPANLINPVASAYLKDIWGKLPLSAGTDVAATTSQFFADRTLLNFRQELVKVDHRFSDRFTIWGKIQNDTIPTVEPVGLFSCNGAFPFTCTTHTNAPGKSWVFHALGIIRPSLVNDVGFNYSLRAILSTPEGVTAKKNAPNVNPQEPFPNTQGVVPNLSFSGGSTLNGYGPYTNYNHNYAFLDNLTWMKGRHAFKFGYAANNYNKTENNPGSPQGTFGFTNVGAPTGTSSFQQSWANFLLGNVSTFTQPSRDITPDVWSWQHEAYAQDDFKATPRLTLYMGVRWSFFGQPTDSNGLMDNFHPGLYDRSKAPAVNPANGNYATPIPVSTPPTTGIIIGGKNSPWGDKIANDSYRNFAPRVGVAWDPFGTGKTALRGGYGIYFDSTLFGIYEQNIFANPPFVQSVNYANAPFDNITSGTIGSITSPLTLHATQIPARLPYAQQWNFTIEERLPYNALLSVAYVGSKGTHLLGIVDINQTPPGVALAAGLHTTTGTGTSGPGTTIFTTADAPRINAVRPYYGYAAINALETAFDSNYHSLQASFRKNFGASGLFNVAFTWAKNLTDNGSDRSNAPQNSYNWHDGEYGPYGGDRKKVLSVNYIYNIPIFKHSKGFVAQALKGWEISGIVQAYSGAPFTVTTSSVDSAGVGFLSGGSQSGPRPDMTCDPRAGQPEQYGSAAQTSAQKLTWFNIACFAATPQGAVRPGNAGRGVVRGPGFFNLDTTLIKNFRVRERFNTQVRVETLNTLNWVNPSSFASLNVTSTVFGQINSFRAPRRVQLALKFSF